VIPYEARSLRREPDGRLPDRRLPDGRLLRWPTNRDRPAPDGHIQYPHRPQHRRNMCVRHDSVGRGFVLRPSSCVSIARSLLNPGGTRGCRRRACGLTREHRPLGLPAGFPGRRPRFDSSRAPTERLEHARQPHCRDRGQVSYRAGQPVTNGECEERSGQPEELPAGFVERRRVDGDHRSPAAADR
jgi:hypothetical protein